MRPFDVEPVGPYYNGLGKSLGDTAVVIYPVDVPPTIDPTPIPVTQQSQLPIIPILILSGIIIFLLLNNR